jgi:hypothetical protein
LEIAATITPQRIRLFPAIDNRSSMGIWRFYDEVLLKYFANAGFAIATPLRSPDERSDIRDGIATITSCISLDCEIVLGPVIPGASEARSPESILRSLCSWIPGSPPLRCGAPE